MATKRETLGRIGEKLVEIELLKKNINFLSMSDNHPYFDLIIDVKLGLKKVQIKTSNESKNGTFQFGLKNCAGDYDYLILVLIKKNNDLIFYIIPVEEIENNSSITLGRRTNKYEKFNNNWDILNK